MGEANRFWRRVGVLTQAIGWAAVFLSLAAAYALNTPLRPFRYFGF